jgi:organic radical activating enzyme
MNILTPASPAAAIELADTLLRTAIRILYESHGDLDFPEHYVRSIAQERLANQLHASRCLESPERRRQVADFVNQLRAEVGLPPTSWDEIVCSAYKP